MSTSSKYSSFKLTLAIACIAGAVQAVASLALESIASVSGYISILALFILARLIGQAHSFKQAFFIAWLFSTIWLCGSVWWLFISMHHYGGMPAIMAVLAVFLLCAGLALMYAFVMGFARILSPKGTLCTVNFAVFWMLAEMLRGWIFTGFPWSATGYAHVDSIFSSYAPWLGVYGVSGVAALVAASFALLYQYIKERHHPSFPLKPTHAIIAVSVIATLCVLAWPLKHGFTQSTGSIRVALLQGNVPQQIKFDRQTAIESYEWYFKKMQQSKQEGAQLVLLPETAITFRLSSIPVEDRVTFRNLFAEVDDGAYGFAALIGAPEWLDEKTPTNSVFGFAPDQAAYRYDKYHLVPFGEFIPPGFHWFVNMMNIPLGDLHRGSIDEPSFSFAQQRIAPNICYEDLFGEELAKRFHRVSEEPTIMANASNIAWFGNTVAIPQHLQIARMRSLEFQRPMIRATNTGATAIINHEGRVTAALPPHQEGVLMGEVEGRSGVTPFVWWASRWGLMPLLIASVIVLLFARFMQRKLG